MIVRCDDLLRRQIGVHVDAKGKDPVLHVVFLGLAVDQCADVHAGSSHLRIMAVMADNFDYTGIG